jgi:O-antigen/teichoic acid export membrane protein
MSFARQSLGSLVALVFGVVVSILLPRVLGAEARGEYQLAVKLAGLVLAIAQWGIPEVLLQLVAEGRSMGTLIGTSLALGLAGALTVAVVLGLAAPLLQDNVLRGVEPVLLWLTLGGSIASIVGLLARRFIQLGGRLDLYNGLDVGRTVLFVALVALSGALLPRNAIGPTAAWLIGELALAVVAAIFLLRTVFPRTETLHFQPPVARELIRSGAPIQFGLLGMFIGSEGGVFVLNANLPLATIGVYSVALAASRLVVQVSIALRTALQPRLVAAEQDSAAITARVTRHGLLWMALVACALALGSPLAPVIFTSEFEAVGPALILLLPGMVAYGVWQLLASHLLRIGRRGLLAATAWLFGLASIALQAFGAHAFGLAGAAAGLSASYVIATIIVLVAFVHLSGRSARELVPVPGDLAFYVGLTRRVLATR